MRTVALDGCEKEGATGINGGVVRNCGLWWRLDMDGQCLDNCWGCGRGSGEAGMMAPWWQEVDWWSAKIGDGGFGHGVKVGGALWWSCVDVMWVVMLRQ